ncbi:hypothetical protein FGG08_000429 [Glutinoglossum americanum]|uniref:Microbial-type PARG catalytic domain-containing protein n=1 Tax=Glutinoglossum americanum TaxID=1670608 RepID=A0A9P8L174_9PEZI|nr:hypothetical protein FGG08_000429 [Glutinoglossum americanum]
MQSAGLRAMEMAAEAKKTYIPYIDKCFPQFPATSRGYPDSSTIRISPDSRSEKRLRFAVVDGDPVDVALGWCAEEATAIPVVNVADDNRPGGNWETGTIAPEEILCRRSNLIQTLGTTSNKYSHYPIPPTGGIYSPHVVVFREGPDHYKVWKGEEFRVLPVISVAPVRRPKLNEAGTQYAFTAARELMKEKLRTILRIAADNQYKMLCVGAFGVGPGFLNPAGEVAAMWKDVPFEEEFRGVFRAIVFAIKKPKDESVGEGETEYDIFNAQFRLASNFYSYVTPPPQEHTPHQHAR